MSCLAYALDSPLLPRLTLRVEGAVLRREGVWVALVLVGWALVASLGVPKALEVPEERWTTVLMLIWCPLTPLPGVIGAGTPHIEGSLKQK